MADAAVRPRRRLIPKAGDSAVALILSVLVIAAMAVFFVLPVVAILWRSFDTGSGAGLGNYIVTLGDPRVWELIGNSLGCRRWRRSAR